MPRKPTNKNVPAIGVLRKKADDLWSLAVKIDGGYKCACCNSRSTLNSHHLIPRQHYRLRYSLDNGLCLCCHCHQFCPNMSPHQNAAGFMKWFKSEYPIRHKWLKDTEEDGKYRRVTEVRKAGYFIAIIRGFKQYVEPDDYTRLVGKKFSAWLEENPEYYP